MPGACTGLLRQVSIHQGWGKPSTTCAQADRGHPSSHSSSSHARAPRLSARCAASPAGPASATMTRPNFPHQGLTDSFGPGASDLSKVAWVSPLRTVFLLLVLVVLGHGDGWMPRTCATPHGTLSSHQPPQLGVAVAGRSKSSGLQRPHHSMFRTERVRCAFHYGSDFPRRGFKRRFGWTARGGESAKYGGRGGVSVHRPAVRI